MTNDNTNALSLFCLLKLLQLLMKIVMKLSRIRKMVMNYLLKINLKMNLPLRLILMPPLTISNKCGSLLFCFLIREIPISKYNQASKFLFVA